MMVRLTLKVLMSMMMKVDDDDIDSGIRKQNPGEGWSARSTSWSSDPLSLSSGSWSAFLLIINYDDICRQIKRQSFFFQATKKARLRAANGSRLDNWICLFDLSCEKLDITISINNDSNINRKRLSWISKLLSTFCANGKSHIFWHPVLKLRVIFHEENSVIL